MQRHAQFVLAGKKHVEMFRAKTEFVYARAGVVLHDRVVEKLKEDVFVYDLFDFVSHRFFDGTLYQNMVYNGWKKADKKPALNVDLWERLLPLLEKHSVTFNWVKGHNGHPYNERCDALAVAYYNNL